MVCQLLALDKIISLTIRLDPLDENIEQFYKVLPQLENLANLIIDYHRNYLFADDIITALKYNSSITMTNINVDSDEELSQILERNRLLIIKIIY